MVTGRQLASGGSTVLGPPEPRSRVDVLLSEVRLSDENADRWLVQLRWVAIAGISATVVVGARLAPGLEARPLALVIGALAVVNVGWLFVVRRRQASDGPNGQHRRTVALQLTGDVLALTLLLWLGGGVENPFTVFLAFQIALAGLLCSPRTAMGIAALTAASVLVLSKAPPLPLGATATANANVVVFGKVVALVLVSGFLGVVVSFYAQRLGALRRESVQNEKLALLGRLVGAMSHELSTPLATILLASRDLATMTRAQGDEDAARLAGTLAGEAERASEILGVVRGHIRPDWVSEPIELVEFVRGVADAELDRLGFRGRREFHGPEPIAAMVLRPALRQVLTNLLTNAAEACAGGCAAPRIALWVTRVGDVAEVTVGDNGPGFSEAIVPRLGEPFQSTKEEQGGLGLGLYVSVMLARRMNAVLRAESPGPGGARVTLSILLGSARPEMVS
jgi:two-component system sensor histidine kinase RegB